MLLLSSILASEFATALSVAIGNRRFRHHPICEATVKCRGFIGRSPRASGACLGIPLQCYSSSIGKNENTGEAEKPKCVVDCSVSALLTEYCIWRSYSWNQKRKKIFFIGNM